MLGMTFLRIVAQITPRPACAFCPRLTFAPYVRPQLRCRRRPCFPSAAHPHAGVLVCARGPVHLFRPRQAERPGGHGLQARRILRGVCHRPAQPGQLLPVVQGQRPLAVHRDEFARSHPGRGAAAALAPAGHAVGTAGAAGVFRLPHVLFGGLQQGHGLRLLRRFHQAQALDVVF